MGGILKKIFPKLYRDRGNGMDTSSLDAQKKALEDRLSKAAVMQARSSFAVRRSYLDSVNGSLATSTVVEGVLKSMGGARPEEETDGVD